MRNWLVVDLNEPAYVRELFKGMERVRFERLEVGDFWIADEKGFPLCIVERKTIRDLYASLRDGRYEKMMGDEVYEHVPLVVVVHGRYEELAKQLRMYGKMNVYKLRGILEGMLLSIVLRRGGSVLWLEGYGLKEVVKIIVELRDKFSELYRMPKGKRGDIRYLAKYFGVSRVLLEKNLKRYRTVLEFLIETDLKRVREVLDSVPDGGSD